MKIWETVFEQQRQKLTQQLLWFPRDCGLWF